MKIHFKTTYWESYNVPDDFTEDQIEDLKQKIKEDKILGYGDLADEFGYEPEMDHDSFLETCDYLSVEYNQGQSTVELSDDDNNIIAQNANNDG